MISIRFLRGACAPFGRRALGTLDQRVRRHLPSGRLEADHLAVVDLAHPALVDQQVDVADHLGEGEEGLGDGDVAPDRLGDLVAGARPLGDQAVDLLLAPLVLGEALVDQRDVVDDRLAVAGEDDLGRQLAGLLQRLDVGDQRLRALVRAVERPRDQRVGGDVGDQVVGGDQDPPLARPRRPCRRGCGRAGAAPRGCGRGTRARSPSSSGRVTPTCEPQPRKLRETLCRAPTPPRGCRCAASARPRTGPRARRPRRSWRRTAATSIAATSAPECSTMISTRPRWSMCWWVRMTSSRSSIEWPRSPSWRCSSSSDLPELGPVSTRVSGSSSSR